MLKVELGRPCWCHEAIPQHAQSQQNLQVTIRLGGYARKFVPVRLAASKSFALAIIAVAWLVATALFNTANARSTDYWSGWNNPRALLAIVWSALGPGALVAFLQSQVRRCDVAACSNCCLCHRADAAVCLVCRGKLWCHQHRVKLSILLYLSGQLFLLFSSCLKKQWVKLDMLEVS